MSPVAFGFRAVKGGSVVVAIATENREPRLVLSTYLATGTDGDRLSIEPYHLAAEIAQRDAHGGISAEVKAIVVEGRKRQDALAARGLDALVGELKGIGHQPVLAALLVNRAGWITDLLVYSLAALEHPPVAEGLAVRNALRFALSQSGIRAVELDEKSLPDVASTALCLSAADIDARLRSFGKSAGRPWRKEQKLACLAAWIAIASGR